MKGNVEIVLKDKDGNVVHREEKHNLVTNFFTEYFKPLGTTRDYPYNYNIENMVGGILLMEDAIAESASTVLLPAGNKMIGNACIGKVNGSGTAVSELGSCNTANTGWQENGDYKMTYEWTPSQANGQISALCLTSKGCGYAGEGNSASNNYIIDSAYNFYSIPYGANHNRSLGSNNSYFGASPAFSDNYNYIIDYRQFNADATYNIARTGKLWIKKQYFPKTAIDFYKGRTTEVTEISETQYNIPNNIASDFITNSSFRGVYLKYVTRDDTYTHFCAASKYYSGIMLTSADPYIYTFHFNRSTETLTAEKVAVDSDVMSEILGQGTQAEIFVTCNSSTIVLCRYALTGNADNVIYFIDIATGNVTRKVFHLPRNINSGYSYIYVDSVHLHYTNVWYLRLQFEVYTSPYTYTLLKVDNVRKTAEITNAYIGNDGTDNPYQYIGVGDVSEYPLAYCKGNSYMRNPKYIATIYNLEEPVTKTSNLSMQITYTLSFNEE